MKAELLIWNQLIIQTRNVNSHQKVNRYLFHQTYRQGYPLLTHYAELQDRKSIQIDWMHPAKLVL